MSWGEKERLQPGAANLKFMFGPFRLRQFPLSHQSWLFFAASLWFSAPSVCLCAVKDASLIYAVRKCG